MKYIAHAAVKLQEGILDEQKNKWVHIKRSANIEYRYPILRGRQKSVGSTKVQEN